MHFQINERFINDYLDLIAVGADHAEAVQQVAAANEVTEAEVTEVVEAL